ncbi:MAG: helix-turn-helix domain-containing protein [Deltaproteobacteria bacterium]|nr:helix-turn-helix domain-containing protein [Deltaproteobacteria bacterium]
MKANRWKSWNDVPPILKTGQVCEFLGLDRRTLDKLAEAGQIRRGLVGGAYRYGRVALKEFTQRANCDPYEAPSGSIC